jgi:hypothetical protein
MKRETKNKIKAIHGAFHKVLLSFCFVWIISSLAMEQIPEVQIAPLYKEAIKAVDPLEILKKGVGNPSDRAEF